MENSTIEWTHHTFNPWIGCTEVNALCTHCYAKTLMDVRYGRAKWGPRGTRVRTTHQYWRKPLAWDRDAATRHSRDRVFCASLADVFEDRVELEPWRHDLFSLIDRTTQLDWLLLTKRPENIGRMWPPMAGESGWAYGAYRHHVWLGTSVGTRQSAELGIPRLLKWRHLVPVLFLSVEPLLEPIDSLPLAGIDWVIVGGESGPGARPMEKEWVVSIQLQCQAARVAFFFKQWGGVQKNRAGRLLDGQTWDAIPSPRPIEQTVRGGNLP